MTRRRSNTRGRAPWIVASLALVCASCADGWSARSTRPETLPPTADQGVRVAVLDRDLDGALDVIRQRAGKVISVATPPVPLLDGTREAGLTLDASGFSVDVATVEAGWSTTGVLAVRLAASTSPLAAVLVRPGEPACALDFTLGDAALDIRVRLVRGLSGVLDVALADEPAFVAADALVTDPSGCLASLDVALADAALAEIEARLITAIDDAVRGRYVPEVRSTLATLLLIDAEGIWATTDAGHAFAWTLGDSGALGEPVAVQRAQGRTSVPWWSSVVMPSRGCVAGERPPPLSPTALPLLPPAAPIEAPGALRRALVLDRAFLRDLIHRLLDAGALCEEVAAGLEARLPAGALEHALPGVAAWTDAARYGARVTAGTWGNVSVVAHPDGARIRWRDTALRLEVFGEVSGTPLVLLQVTGDAELEWQLLVEPGGPRLTLVASRFGNVTVQTPLFAGAAPALDEPTLSSLLEAALQGIGAGDRALFATAAWADGAAPWPSGTVSVAATAVGEQLWLWLDTVPAAP